MRLALSLGLLLLSACKPPAADNYVERVELKEQSRMASPSLPSPNVEGAVWAQASDPMRILYGIPGEVPMLALACRFPDDEPTLHITRFSRADPEAKALMAFVGNGHIARVPMDAVHNGRAWLWEGDIAAETYALGALTGPRKVSATLPGAGMVGLNASPMPGELIELCREGVPKREEPSGDLEMEVDAADPDQPAEDPSADAPPE